MRYRYIPTWENRLIDAGLHFVNRFKRYPLADQVNSLSCRPLFIISSGRAGTTLVRSMLAVGGEIAMPPESFKIPIAIRRFLALRCLRWEDMSRLIVALFESSGNFQLWKTDLRPAYPVVINLPERERSLARVVDEVFKCYANQQFPDARLWGDQSPVNTLHLPRIFRTFPEARYLHLLRDGRDAISSMVKRGRSIEDATSRWIASVRQALALQSRLEPAQFLEIRYEDLVSQPSGTLQSICAFSDIAFTDEMLDFWRSPTTIEDKHYEHHRNLARPIFTSSIGKWRERLSSSEQEYVRARTTGLLERLGYSS